MIADLDGDGRDEVAVSLRLPGDIAQHMLLLRQTDDGGLDPFVIGHCQPLAAVRLADDASALLVVDAETRSLWALGVGAEPFPPVTAPTAESVPPPPALTDEGLRRRWTRADDLAVAGMPASAAEILRDGASMVPGDALRRRFRDRAAALFALAGEPELALELDADNLDDPELAPGALLRRATLLTDLGAYQSAAEAAEALLSHPRHRVAQAEAAEALLDRLAPLRDARETVDLRFDAAMLPTWRIERPAALRLDPVAGALRVEALGDQGHLAALPVRWDGGPLEIEVDLDIVEAQYNSALHFALVDGLGQVLLGVGVRGGGDRGDLHQAVDCWPVGQDRVTFAARDVTSTATRRRLVARVTFFPDRGLTECAAVVDDQRTHRRLRTTARPPAGLHSLVIGSADPYTIGLIVAEVRRITLRGARLDDAALDPSPTAAVRHALVAGDAARAFSLIDRVSPDDPDHPLLALLLHDALARPVPPGLIDRALSRLSDADLLHLLRTRAALAPALRAAAGGRALDRFA
ncbi:MAG TPA: hypothetical protein VIK91_00130, partial [Nannocystis sp.]